MNKRKGHRAQGQMEQMAKVDSASEIMSLYDAVHLNLKGSCTANGSRGSTALLNVCTYNVRIIIIIIAFKGAIRDFLQSPHSAANCLKRTLKWPGRNRVQITCNTSSAYHLQVSSYVPLGTKGQLSY